MILTNIILAVLVLVQIYALIKRAQFERKNYQDLFKDKLIEENEKVEEMSKKIEDLWKCHEEKIEEIVGIQSQMRLDAKNHLETHHY